MGKNRLLDIVDNTLIVWKDSELFVVRSLIATSAGVPGATRSACPGFARMTA
jgi:hypothetical protein